MNNLNLGQIEYSVKSLANKIMAPRDYLPSFGKPTQDAHPHIEVDDQTYYYVITERGQECERRTTADIDELLYWIFESITFSMGTKFELSHRIFKQDCRRLIFQKQAELLSLLNPGWVLRYQQETEKLLDKYPFDDLAGLRAAYSRRLREKGFSENKIEELADKKYPNL